MMLVELVLGVGLALAAVWYVMGPVLRPDPRTGARAAQLGAEDADAEEDLSPRATALRALKEIEFDRATGKLSDDDYEALKHRYTAEAVVALRAEAGTGPSAVATEPATTAAACPEHGPRPEGEAEFCSECGRRLGTGPAFCARCGAALERGANYCNGCGMRVAA